MSVIYKISDVMGYFYIGSTTNLKQRIRSHKSDQCSCAFCKHHGVWNVEILEHTDKIGNDLLWMERNYYDINKSNPLFTNRKRPIATKEEIKELKQQHYEQNKEEFKQRSKEHYQQYKEDLKQRSKDYYQEHKEEQKAKVKAYREQNSDKIKARDKAYREQNKDKIKAYKQQNSDKIKARDKAYYEQNKDKIKAYQQQYREQNKAYLSEKIECECGAVIRRDYKREHLKTKKHLKLIQNKNI